MQDTNLIKPQEIPLKIVGSNKYGRYQKISDEETFNMIISDGFLVNYAGYKIVLPISVSAVGRALYTSERWRRMLAVIGNVVYGVTASANGLSYFTIGTIKTYTGDVFIDENIAGQIAICDGQSIYIYNWASPTSPAIQEVNLPVDPRTGYKIIPGYITYQDGYFITVNTVSANWFLSKQNDGTDWNWGAGNLPVYGSIQTKPTNAVAVLRAPGKGNLLYVFGRTVTEMWYDVGNALFPYQRSTSVSIDYGCVSPTSIAALDNYIAWLGINEKSGPVIMISSGAEMTKLSNDGIDFKLASLTRPDQSYAFFFRQDGHLFYQISFVNPADNLTLVYDFNTQSFFTATDENMNFHIAERVAFFNNKYYFVSLRDGSIYETGSSLTTFDYSIISQGIIKEYEIPRVRVTAPLRLPNSDRFLINNLTITVEQGSDESYKGSYLFIITTEDGFAISEENDSEQDILPAQLQTETVVEPYQPRIDLSLSKDGAVNFSSYIHKNMNPLGKRRNKVIFWQLGSANDLSVQFRFWSKSRVVVTDGVIDIYA